MSQALCELRLSGVASIGELRFKGDTSTKESKVGNCRKEYELTTMESRLSAACVHGKIGRKKILQL